MREMSGFNDQGGCWLRGMCFVSWLGGGGWVQLGDRGLERGHGDWELRRTFAGEGVGVITAHGWELDFP